MSTLNSNVSVVRSIGKGVRLTDEAVSEVVGYLADRVESDPTFDPEGRGVVAEAVHMWACGDTERPAVKSGPKGEQTTTDYGRGHDTLTKAVKRAIALKPTKPVSLKVTYVNADGESKSVHVDPTTETGAALLALFGADGE